MTFIFVIFMGNYVPFRTYTQKEPEDSINLIQATFHKQSLYFITTHKRSLGNLIFSVACVKVSVHGGVCSKGGCLLPRGLLLGVLPAPGGLLPGGVPAPRRGLLPGGSVPGGSAPRGVPAPWGSALGVCVWRPLEMATAVGGTHPTGMHSC